MRQRLAAKASFCHHEREAGAIGLPSQATTAIRGNRAVQRRYMSLVPTECQPHPRKSPSFLS